MHVAQLPASHENGGAMPIWRAVCRIVVPGRWSVGLGAAVELDRHARRRRRRVRGRLGEAAGSAGVKRSMWMRLGVDAVARAACPRRCP